MRKAQPDENRRKVVRKTPIILEESWSGYPEIFCLFRVL